MATHLYFDHPYEPDPEERGLHWATRYTNTQKTFGFIPEDIFANADVNRDGEPYDLADLCNNQTCPKTKHPENIAGIDLLTICMQGNFPCLCYCLLDVFKIIYFRKFFQEHYQRVKRFGSRSGPNLHRS